MVAPPPDADSAPSLSKRAALDATIAASFGFDLLSRVEDAGLNASAPREQRWIDGWLVRFSPGQAKRARCVNAVAAGRLDVASKLALCERLYGQAGLPFLVRITPFSVPPDLDSQLAEIGMLRIDETRVMVLSLDRERTSRKPLLQAQTSPPRQQQAQTPMKRALTFVTTMMWIQSRFECTRSIHRLTPVLSVPGKAPAPPSRPPTPND